MSLIIAEVESTITKLRSDGATGLIIETMGITILYTPGPVLEQDGSNGQRQKSIRSPSQRLTVTDVLMDVALPGIDYSGLAPGQIRGFTGGTVIAEGFYNTNDDGTGTPRNVFLANHLELDPAENVLIGAITSVVGGVIRINNIVVSPLVGELVSSNPGEMMPRYLNQFYFPIDPASITVTPMAANPAPPATPPAESAAEGYFAGGKFYAHLFNFGDSGRMLPQTAPVKPLDYPRISIERADVRVGADEDGITPATFEIDVRGFATKPLRSGVDHQIELFALQMKAGTLGTNDSDWEYVGGSATTAKLPPADDIDIAPVFDGVPGDAGKPPVQRWRYRAEVPISGALLLPPERIRVRNVTAEDALNGAGGTNEVRAEEDTSIRE